MWKKKILCLAALLCVLLLATACQQKQETFPNQPRQNTETQQPAAIQETAAPETSGSSQTDYDDGSYNPALEEGGESEYIGDSASPAPTIYSDYAGATPVKIDPIDKPTPTPLPKLTFAYTTYQSNNLHLTFDGPAGWMAEESADSYMLINPDPSMDYAAKAEIRVTPVNKNYTQKELAKEVSSALDAQRSNGGYDTFETSQTATRTFIDGNGVYASFKGTLKNPEGTGVAGRIIINTVNKNLYVMTVTYPRGLADTFAEGVYNKIRHSMKLTN